MRRIAIVVLLLAVPAVGQTTASGTATYSGSAEFAENGGGAQLMTGENAYCPPAASGELTEGMPLWGAYDSVAQLPTRCMNTALSSTPSGTHIGGAAATTFMPGDSEALTSVLVSLECGDTIELAAGATYTGTFTFPNLACDGGHWITVKSSGVSDLSFPAEGTRATPCIAGISNDATNGRSLPGYPDFPCASYPSVLTAKIEAPGTSGRSAINFAAGANHYRFVGLEITKYPGVRPGQLIELAADNQTLGVNQVIFDRMVIHGEAWTTSTDIYAEVQNGISAKNSQWVALVNSWNYDTYCNSSCIDSHAFGGGTGAYQDEPFKVYGSLLASSGEPFMLGGGGVGVNTPNTQDFEVRGNHMLHPLAWMVPIESCPAYPSGPVVKNLGELKNGVRGLWEGNFFENNWQGCQGDQFGEGLAIGPRNQNNHKAATLDFDRTEVASISAGSANNFDESMADPAGCPPGGCVIELTSEVDDQTHRICNGTNGCDQTGVSGWPTTQARMTKAHAPASAQAANICPPGDCPSCRVEHVTIRYNEFANMIKAVGISSGRSSHCLDEAAGLGKISVHDNLARGLSLEMSNGSDPFTHAEAFSATNGQLGGVVNAVSIRHNTVAVETGSSTTSSGLGVQRDGTDRVYLENLEIADNVSNASWYVSHTSGSLVSGGLASAWRTQSCRPYYPNEAPGGMVQAGNLQSFTFAPGLTSYIVTVNGLSKTLAASDTNSFTLEAAAGVGDSITVRDLNECSWVFAGNILGAGMAGSGKDQSPYPNSNDLSCGAGRDLACVLDGGGFTANFQNWGTGRSGDFSLATDSAYRGSATDAATRAVTGRDPGADFTVLAQMTQGTRLAEIYYPALSITTSVLPGATVGAAYQASLQASPGASLYKNWWLETDPVRCDGDCGAVPAGIVIGRSGTVIGPFTVLTVSRSANVATFTPKQTIVAGSWAVGQAVTLCGFVNGSDERAEDASFNGSCVISAMTDHNFSCVQAGADVASHSPQGAGGGTPTGMVTFAPTTAGSFQFWMGTSDGAFQEARGEVSLAVN